MWKGKQKRIRSRVLLCTNTLESWTEVLTASTWWKQRNTEKYYYSSCMNVEHYTTLLFGNSDSSYIRDAQLVWICQHLLLGWFWFWWFWFNVIINNKQFTWGNTEHASVNKRHIYFYGVSMWTLLKKSDCWCPSCSYYHLSLCGIQCIN